MDGEGFVRYVVTDVNEGKHAVDVTTVSVPIVPHRGID